MPTDSRPRDDDPRPKPNSDAVRQALGSWLEGPRAAGVEFGYPGERLGLPEAGSGSVARAGRRLSAFAIDALLCAAIANGLLGGAGWTTLVFAVEAFVLSLLVGGSFGQRALGIQIVSSRGDGRPAAWQLLLRTVLLCLLVPALIWDRDSRGWHDKLAGTVLVRV